MECSFKPYEGTDSYIFVSYSHSDSESVSKILNALSQNGYRIWYDDGIEWGAEWPESIAVHLSRCTVCVAFHSKSSLKSVNCRQEIYYALKNKRTLVSIFLDDVVLPSGLDMQLSLFQSVKYKLFKNLDEFITALGSMDIFLTCIERKQAYTNAEADSVDSDSDYNIDAELRQKFKELFGTNKSGDNQKNESALIRKANDIKSRNFMKSFDSFNQGCDDYNDSDNSVSAPLLISKRSSFFKDQNRKTLKGKHFSIIDGPGQKTVVFEVYIGYSHEKLARFYDLEMVDMTETVLDGGATRRTYYIDDPQKDGNRLILFTFQANEVMINNGILIGDEVRITKKPMPFSYNSPFFTNYRQLLSGSAYDMSSLSEKASYKLSGKFEGRWFPAEIDYPQVILIDPDTAMPVTREVYEDEITGELKARVFLNPYKSYFAFNMRSIKSDDVYEPLNDLEIGIYYTYGCAGFPKDVDKGLEYLEKSDSPDALFEIAKIFLEMDEYNDVEIGMEYLKMAVEKGHAGAQNYLGVCYENGNGVKKDLIKAVYYYRMAADQGDENALSNLGDCYKNGVGVERNPIDAVRWYRLAAEKENYAAQFTLGVCYELGEGTIQSFDEAMKLYSEVAEYETEYFIDAVESGPPGAQTYLGSCYEIGKFVKQDMAEAVKWYKLAAEQGYAAAQNHLGLCYDNGDGVEVDKAKAVIWYRKAAEQGYVAAQNNLGLCYDNGDGVEVDKEEAVKWYRKAAEQGNADAQNYLGLCYDNGDGVEVDKVEAVRWYRKAAEQGNADAQYNLGMCYEYGEGVEQNAIEAVRWYRKAADQDYSVSQNKLGNCYIDGYGVETDNNEAFRLIYKAAVQGYGVAQNNLGWCYEHGIGVVENEVEAVRWYQRAANNGNIAALNHLGDCYKCGYGVEMNKAEATKWYRMAAEQGNRKAQKNLGDCFYNGDGVTEDKAEALKWYRMSAEQGYQEAKDAISNGPFPQE